MNDFSTWDIARNLLLALRWTVFLSLIAFVCGGIAGLALLLARISKNRVLQLFAKGYIELFQGTPLLLQLYLLFFGLALFGMEISPLQTATLCR